MILPWLRGLVGWSVAPLTWTLIAINVLFYLLTVDGPSEVPNLTRQEILWAGRYYSQIKGEQVPADPSQLLLKGAQALRDPIFFQNVPKLQAGGDAWGFEHWRLRMLEFQSDLERRPVDFFGLHADAHRPLSWVTYQFMHSGLLHLGGNMLMLLIFGAALEQLTGSFLLVAVYLLGGFAGAWSFLLLSGSTTAPMVGASASLSAVMAFYTIIEKRRRVRFFFFVSPSPGYFGDIYLPTLIVIPLYFVEDLASYLSTSEEIGTGIAYAAHIGGAGFGLATALVLRWVMIKSPRWEQILYASYSRSRTGAP